MRDMKGHDPPMETHPFCTMRDSLLIDGVVGSVGKDLWKLRDTEPLSTTSSYHKFKYFFNKYDLVK